MDFFSPASSKLEDVLEWTLLWSGIVFLILGLVGITIMLSGYRVLSDRVLQFAFTFVSFYMLFIGLFLIFYRKKIVVKS